MYVITTTFIGDSAAIEATRRAHGQWLDEQLADGLLLVAGRQDPRVGGIVITSDVAREELERRLADEPFARNGLATHAAVRFRASRAAPGLERLLEA